MKRTAAPVDAAWRNRIVGHGDEDPQTLAANPANWRSHPRAQQRALTGALSEVGWVAQVLVNQTTGHVVDGHLRLELAVKRGEPTVPVMYVELSEAEEKIVLATLDPIGALARPDEAKLRELLADLTTADEDLARLLRDLGAQATRGLTDPDAVPEVPDESSVEPVDAGLQAVGRAIRDGMTVDPSCVGLLGEIPSYTWAPNRAGGFHERPIEVNDDACDALRYGVMAFAPNPNDPWAGLVGKTASAVA